MRTPECWLLLLVLKLLSTTAAAAEKMELNQQAPDIEMVLLKMKLYEFRINHQQCVTTTIETITGMSHCINAEVTVHSSPYHCTYLNVYSTDHSCPEYVTETFQPHPSLSKTNSSECEVTVVNSTTLTAVGHVGRSLGRSDSNSSVSCLSHSFRLFMNGFRYCVPCPGTLISNPQPANYNQLCTPCNILHYSGCTQCTHTQCTVCDDTHTPEGHHCASDLSRAQLAVTIAVCAVYCLIMVVICVMCTARSTGSRCKVAASDTFYTEEQTYAEIDEGLRSSEVCLKRRGDDSRGGGSAGKPLKSTAVVAVANTYVSPIDCDNTYLEPIPSSHPSPHHSRNPSSRSLKAMLSPSPKSSPSSRRSSKKKPRQRPTIELLPPPPAEMLRPDPPSSPPPPESPPSTPPLPTRRTKQTIPSVDLLPPPPPPITTTKRPISSASLPPPPPPPTTVSPRSSHELPPLPPPPPEAAQYVTQQTSP